MHIQLNSIGVIRSTRSDPIDDRWDAETSTIVLDESVVGHDAVVGLEQFSHIEVFYYFHKVPNNKIVTNARRPRGNPDWPEVGIYAQRGKNRPNRLGATICALKGVDGLTIHVQGLDAIDATPVLDVKPVMTEFLPRSTVIQPLWATRVMQDYWE